MKSTSNPKFSRLVEEYFLAWINVSTWFTENPYDNGRFFAFVKAVLRHSRIRPSESDVKAMIMKHGNIEPTMLESEARRFSSLYFDLLAFSDAPFPNALLAARTAKKFYAYLTLGRIQRSESEIDAIMRDRWGDDWRDDVDL